MLRLFTGLAIPDSIAERLKMMQGGIPGARWTAGGNYHITLTFIGEVDEAGAEDIDAALSSIRAAAFTLHLQGIGHFAQGSDPKVMWAGVGANDALFALKEKIDRALDAARIGFEKRKYTPHVTLARFRYADDFKTGDFMAAHGDYESAPFNVGEFILYQSHLTKNGPVYEALARYPLFK